MSITEVGCDGGMLPFGSSDDSCRGGSRRLSETFLCCTDRAGSCFRAGATDGTVSGWADGCFPELQCDNDVGSVVVNERCLGLGGDSGFTSQQPSQFSYQCDNYDC